VTGIWLPRRGARDGCGADREPHFLALNRSFGFVFQFGLMSALAAHAALMSTSARFELQMAVVAHKPRIAQPRQPVPPLHRRTDPLDAAADARRRHVEPGRQAKLLLTLGRHLYSLDEASIRFDFEAIQL
jgi:hypothetical protein